jgi:WD40 repeat protein
MMATTRWKRCGKAVFISCCIIAALCAAVVAQNDPEPAFTVQVGSIKDAAFSPDGDRLAVAGLNGGVRLYNTETWELVWETLLHDNALVPAVCFPPDGSVVAASIAGETTIVFLDVATGEETKRFTLLGDKKTFLEVGDMVFSPDGTLLACSSGGYGQVKIIDAATGKAVGKPIVIIHPVGIWSPHSAFSPDGQLLASGCPGNEVIVIDVESQEEVANLGTFGIKNLNDLAFSPDGTLLAAGGSDATRLLLWDTATWSKTYLPVGKIYTAGSLGGSLSFSPDGQLLAAGNKELQIWNVETRELLSSHAIYRRGYDWVEFTPDGSQLAILGARKTSVTLWEIGVLLGE